jgi:glycosyltransferase involved in cell wall biosynthesis
MAYPLVSICLPTYNAARFVKRAVHCAISQDYPNFEVVVCDDCSTDGTWEFLQGLNHPQLRVYRNEINLGVAENHNRTVRLSKGELIKFLHNDDEMAKDTLSYMVPWLKEHPSLVGAVVSAFVIDEDSMVVGEGPKAPSVLRVRGADFLKSIGEHGNQVGTPGQTLLRKDFFWAVSGVSSNFNYYYDLNLWVKLSKVGDWLFLPRSCYYYRYDNVSSISYSFREWQKLYEAFLESWAIADEAFRETGLYRLSKEDFLKWKQTIGGNQFLHGIREVFRDGTPHLLLMVIEEARAQGVLAGAIWNFLQQRIPYALASLMYGSIFKKSYTIRYGQQKALIGTPGA